LTIFYRAIMIILVWGLLLEILSVIYLSPTPSRFEFAYSLFLLTLTSIVLIFMIWRLKRSATKNPRVDE
jgi:FtsH-binding integral membrane protein